MEQHLAFSVVNVYHYLADNFEDEIISVDSKAILDFTGKISSIETVSIMRKVGLHISQLRTLFLNYDIS